jgi:tetratricopeptide (TPR) repeat protein
MSLLKYVLDQYPVSRFRELPYDHLSAEELAFVAHSWVEEHRTEEAAKLLEPLFADVSRLDSRAEWAFDVLADAYSELQRPRKKRELVERVAQADDRTLASAALHRRITMIADQGDYATAWRLFEQAQRHEPGNPSLAPLELTLLLSQGERERARERGQFWIARLARDRDHDYSELIATLRELVEHPDQMYLMHHARGEPQIAVLADLLQHLPAPECRYRLQVRDGDAGVLQADAHLRKLQARWHNLAPVSKPTLTSPVSDGEAMWLVPERWIDWLAKNPLAWQSFDVLDDVVLALHGTGGGLGIDNTLMKPLLDHAETLLRAVLAANGAERSVLAWGLLDNRPALRLLAQQINYCTQQKQAERAAGLLEWLVLTLNPHDNHGFRDPLVLHYLSHGRADAALALCERYAEDSAAMHYNHALALFMLGRHAHAMAALGLAREHYPKVWRMLNAANPVRPRLDSDYVTVGGNDEAWLYRQEALPLWLASGALAWAKLAAQRAKRLRAAPGQGELQFVKPE